MSSPNETIYLFMVLRMSHLSRIASGAMFVHAHTHTIAFRVTPFLFVVKWKRITMLPFSMCLCCCASLWKYARKWAIISETETEWELRVRVREFIGDAAKCVTNLHSVGQNVASSFIRKPFFNNITQMLRVYCFCYSARSCVQIKSMLTTILYFIDKCVNFVDTKA